MPEQPTDTSAETGATLAANETEKTKTAKPKRPTRKPRTLKTKQASPDISQVDEVKTEKKKVAPKRTGRRPNSISARATAMRKLDLAVRVTGLAKRYDDTAAVDTINFDVPRGKIYGIVGPNGAGKTTTLMMMTGLVRPDTGRITINDIDVWTNPEESKALMGVMPDRFVLFDRLTGWQMLYYAGVLRGMTHQDVKKRSEELVKLFGLENSASRLVQDYSAGMVKKLSLACAMIHSPEVLVLDEPFESVDPVSTAALIRVLREQSSQGVTVILSSHNMKLVNRVCDFLAIIVDGRVLDQGEIDDVLRGKTLEERFVDLVGAQQVNEAP